MHKLQASGKRELLASSDSTSSLREHAAPIWRRLATIVGTVTFFVFCSLPGLFLSLQSVRAPWTLFRLARSNLALQSNHIATFAVDASAYRAEHLGSELIYAALLKLTAWPPGTLAIVPLGALVLPVAYYAVAHHLSGSRIIAAGIAVFSGWYYPRLYSQYGLQAYVWTNILFLGFLLVFHLWLVRRTIWRSMLLVVIFTGTFLHYQATPVWLIVMLVVAVILQSLRHERDSDGIPRASWSLPVFCIVVYLFFDTVLYGNVLARLRDEATGESLLESIVSRVLVPLRTGSPPELPPFVTAPVNPALATRTTLIVMVLLATVVLCWFVFKSYQGIRNRNLTPLMGDADYIFIWAVVAAATTHAFLYSLYGALSLRVVPLAFPLLLPLIARDLPLPRRTDAFLAVALAGLAILGFVSFAANLSPDLDTNELGLSAKLVGADERVLADAGVYGSVLLKATEDDKVVNFTWLDSGIYASLTNPNEAPPTHFDFLFADRMDRPIISLDWRNFEPWTQHLGRITKNPGLNKIYESEKLIVFQPSYDSPPNYRLVSKDVSNAPTSILVNSLRLFLAIILIMLMPGFAIVFLFRKDIKGQPDEPMVAAGLSLAISVAIATFLGYLANFTPMGLRWLPYLIILTPFLLVAVSLVFKRQDLPIRKKESLLFTSIAALVLSWSLLSAWVTDARITQRSKMIEFFVTEDKAQGQLYANIVNNSGRLQNYTVRVSTDGAETYQSQEIELAPREPMSFGLPADATDRARRIDLTLVQDDVPLSQLWISPAISKQD